MDLAGKQTVSAPVEVVWAALNDPDMLRQCIKGCTEFSANGENNFDVKMTVTLGPMKVKFSGTIALSDMMPLQGYVISADAEGLYGMGRGSGVIHVEIAEAEAGKTNIGYTVEANVAGKIAQLGSRLIQSSALKLTNDFFAAFDAKLSSESIA